MRKNALLRRQHTQDGQRGKDGQGPTQEVQFLVVAKALPKGGLWLAAPAAPSA